jgi:hypothetical protein
MANIQVLQGKLEELSNKLATKDKLGKDYKRIVSESLDRIKQKITKIIDAHNKKIQEITSESTSNLEKTRAELAMEQDKIKQTSNAALEEAARHKAVLQDNLEKTTMELNDLQAQLSRPNPDIPKMQAIIDDLRKSLDSSQKTTYAAYAQVDELKAKLVEYDGLRDKMDQLVKDLLNKIGEILGQVDAMSINQDDIMELMDLLNETENMFSKDDDSSSGNDNDGGFFGNLFGSSTPTSAATSRPAATSTPASASTSAATSTPDSVSTPAATSALQQRPPRGANTALGQSPPVNLILPSRGGKTKRYRNRGGYINRLRTKKHRKHTRTNKRRSSRSSKSSSKSSKHSA